MSSKTTVFLVLILVFFLGLYCTDTAEDSTSPTETAQQPLNPNGDSELALLMRAMFEEAQQIQQQIAEDQPLSFSLSHEQILTAAATEPEKAASDEYQALATAYLHSVEQLRAAPVAEQHSLYQNMVGNCMSCHKALCPGPMMRIKKLQ
ncbi:MAG: hypothetical protein KDC44_10845 [Phaeodactylibacter sp.]|nr:hypothetical protein [Phaeodactylibacter sp.]